MVQRLYGIVQVKVPKLQAAATLSQAAPVQNTYYTVLDTQTNCRMLGLGCAVADTNETLQLRITIDGQTFSATQAAVAGTIYYLTMNVTDAILNFILTNTNPSQYRTAFLLEGRSVKIEIRKTTAAGAGTITAACGFALW